MKTILLNILGLILGLFVGSMVNMGIIELSSSIIPPPNGIDTTTAEGLQKAMELFEFKHYIFPFLAHALGTLVGALVTALIAKTYRKTFALIVGLFFLFGGISMFSLIKSPLTFILVDTILAYLPCAFIGYKLAKKIKAN